ncbi:MAG: hypothetical protein HYU66_27310 [Armatimonadetes bacterium]|nr:hypothetical protein [Armatimonadota bacterium]
MLFACLAPLLAVAPPVALLDPGDPALLPKLQAHSVALQQVPGPDGKPALQVTYEAGPEWPNVFFPAGETFERRDWSGYGVLAFTLTNPTKEAFTVSCRVDDAPGADGWSHCRQGGVQVPAGATVTAVFRLAGGIEGMRGQPPAAENTPKFDDNGRPLEPAHIAAFQLFLDHPKAPHTLILSRVELREGGPVAAFVDRYGQYNGADWPGKLHDEAELRERLAQETADLLAHPAPPDRDKWGGWQAGPQLDATGLFRTVKHEGKWWLVDPDGRLFWSAGVDVVLGSSNGPIKGREGLFTWLPEAGSPLARFAANGWADFYAMNLHRKYGDADGESWRDMAHRRLASWGFNTIGNWSDAKVCRDRRTPYTAAVHYGAPALKTGYYADFPDVYNPAFATAVDAAMANAARGRERDPWCLGYFIDNELAWAPWGGRPQPLATAILGMDGTVDAKQALVKLLRARFADITALNAKWGTALASWDALLAPVRLDGPAQQKAAEDLAAFETHLAERYFTTCRDAVRKHAPGTLYLGCRFASWSTEAVAVAGRLCDVVCFNIYARSPLDRAGTIARIDAPVVIGEFHFGALDRGMFHTGLVPTASQAERAASFEKYLREAMAAPWCVGAHWFQYVDEQLTGRFDGENYNIGFVSASDTPYPEMVAAARRVNGEMYRLRGAQP